jgi:hypothetical protein
MHHSIFQVESLLQAIHDAKTSSSNRQKMGEAADSSWMSLLGLGPSQDFNTSHYHSSEYDEMGFGDVRKLSYHLEQAATNFEAFFEVCE